MLWIVAVQDKKEEMHTENLRSQGNSGSTSGTVKYSNNQMTDTITCSCKGNK